MLVMFGISYKISFPLPSLIFEISPNQVLQSNIRLEWKFLAREKQSSLSVTAVGDEEKKFYKIFVGLSLEVFAHPSYFSHQS